MVSDRFLVLETFEFFELWNPMINVRIHKIQNGENTTSKKWFESGFKVVLFSAFQMMLAKVKGSLYYAVLFVSVIFAAATGIVGASVTILGIMAAKSMNRSGYDVRLAAGTITAGGTLGILIPPSIMLVVMGPIMEIPVIDLFAAAIIPGILLASLYAAYTTIRCMINPKLGPVLPEDMRAASMLSLIHI